MRVLIVRFPLGSDNESDEEGLGRKALTAQVTRGGRSCPSFLSLVSQPLLWGCDSGSASPSPPWLCGHTPRGHRLGRPPLASRAVPHLPEVCLGAGLWVPPSKWCCCC